MVEANKLECLTTTDKLMTFNRPLAAGGSDLAICFSNGSLYFNLVTMEKFIVLFGLLLSINTFAQKIEKFDI